MHNRSDSLHNQILIVDDSIASLKLLVTMLGNAGYDVRTATDGNLALHSIAISSPDLILLDIKMPGMDGFEVCRHLKANEKTASIPVIFISVIENENERIKGFELGAVDYVNKPFQPEEVLARVNTHISLRNTQLELEQSNKELRAIRDTLEIKVKERSTQLELANNKLENRIKENVQYSEKLAKSNAELEQFSYIVSHDLQEPIITIMGFLKLLLEDSGNKLDEDMLHYINSALESSKRMKRLIKSILMYSHVQTQTGEIQSVNMDKAFETALLNLNAAIVENNATVKRDPLPVVNFDESQAVQLLQNLIGNAIKYRKNEESPRIQVSANKVDGEWLFYVKDNGIGIKHEYKEKIFEPFRKLPAKSSDKGTGIGLAICKKIVERNNGKIWVESAFGQGSTFYFTIPV